jgi:hypothetical protein
MEDNIVNLPKYILEYMKNTSPTLSRKFCKENDRENT